MAKSKRNIRGIKLFSALLILAFLAWPFLHGFVNAQQPSISELRSKIEEKNREIEALNKEIAKTESELGKVSKEANTLQSAVKSLDLERQKLLKDVERTEREIDSSELSLEKLGFEIDQTEEKIDKNNEGLSEALRLVNEAGETSMIEVLLKYEDIAAFWDEIDSLQRFQAGVKQNLSGLKSAKEILEEKVEEKEIEKKELENFKSDLDAQHRVVEINKNQKQNLLVQTKNKESEYKILLEEIRARKAAFEKELFEFESQLQIAIDPTKIPSARNGVLSWPLDSVFVTQLFGKTVDSKRLYASGTHNGVDFRASMGTRVKSALAGVVSHIGNTDEVPGCYSFGRWVLVEHNNGLSTLYSHLSITNVSPGQVISTGDIIGYSGGAPGTSGAGYSTGPHLHFGLYATEGLRPQRYKSNTPCNGAYMPLADQKAYLDPLAYLPPLAN